MYTAYFLKGLDGFEYGKTIAAAEIEYFAAFGAFALFLELYGQGVCMGNIAYMDEIAYAGAITGIIIITIYLHQG